MLNPPPQHEDTTPMTRRDFVRMLALLAAGTAALPEQIRAFEFYYNANTPLSGGPFIAVDELFIGGIASGGSTPIRINLFVKETNVLPLAMNAFGGILFWRAAPDRKLISQHSDFRYVIEHFDAANDEWVQPPNIWVRRILQGYITYIDQDAIRHNITIDAAAGTLTAAEPPKARQ